MLSGQRLVMRGIAGAAGKDHFDWRPYILHGFDQQRLSLLRFEAAGIKDVIALRARAQTISQWWRMIQHLAVEVVVSLQPVGNRARIGENLFRFRNKFLITMFDPFADAGAFGKGRKIVKLSAPKVISRAMLVQNPKNFVWMRNQVGRKLHSDH